MTDTKRDAFYVGYLPLPGKHRAFLAVLAPLLCVAALGAAGAIAAAQRSPGDAVWDTVTKREWTGVLFDDPYPLLMTEDDGAFLVVGMGKFSVHDRVTPAVGNRVRLSGFLLERDGRRMIELDLAEDAIAVLESAPEARLAETQAQPITLTGEIVDGKCFLGAMKPGDGKGHKSCAVLCIEGGLPAMIASRTTDGRLRMDLLLVDGSTEIPPGVLGLVAEQVTIRGDIRNVGGISIVDARADDIAPALR